MSDFDSSLPIRTQNNGDVVAFLADGTTPTQLLGIDAAGKITVKLSDGGGTAITSQSNGAQQALDVGINVAGVQIDPRAIRALTNADVVTVEQGAAAGANTSPWWVRLTDGTNDSAILATGELKVAVTQPLPAGTNSIGTVKAQLQDNAGTAITLGQKAMAASVPVVIASDQSDLNVRVKDGAGNAISSTLINSKQRLDVNGASDGTDGASAPFQTTQVGGKDGSGNLQTLSTDANGQLKVDLFDASGNPFSVSNPLPVTISDSVAGATEVLDFKQATAIAAGASDTHNYSTTATKALKLYKVQASGSGKIKVEIKMGTTGSEVLKAVLFNSTANPNCEYIFAAPQSLADTQSIKVVITNKDNQSQDVYSTIEGYEV